MARTKLSFATCNLYNLNEPGLRLYSDADGWSQDEYNQKISWMTNLITNLETDVWAFQELWHTKSLQHVFAGDTTNEYTLLAPIDHSGQKIICAAAVKSNVLVGAPEWIYHFPENFQLSSGGDDNQASDIAVQINSFSRPVLHFQIKPRSNGRKIHVYVCHFKSKRPTRIYYEPWYSAQAHSKHSEAIGSAISTIRRTAEATALRMILTEQMKGTNTPVVVIGDLNDSQQSNTLNIITGQPNYLLSGLSKGGSDVDLYSVGTLQEYRSQRDVYYTHVYNKTRESLDHILVSQEFYDNSRNRIWAFKGMEIINDHLNSDDHKANGSTDHGIVRTEFEYRPA
ncbi:MAG: endonuclease/exonuclease/phosphatase family protein [Betaproteobacteria bacterium]|nr:endonuclease/exonuclease/phosphatase family protein [Betaproteobacteria bacterium]